MATAGVDMAFRRGRLQASPHLYNSEADVDKALEVLAGAWPTSPRTLKEVPWPCGR